MHRSINTIALWALLWLATGSGLAAQVAQPSGADEIPLEAETESAEDGSETWWAGIRGERTPDRLYAGLWTLHLQRTEDGLSQHHLLAFGWRGMYFGTFVNTHGNRTWALALARSAVAMEGTEAGFSLGYRIGLMAGYDERLARVAGRWPAIPGAEIVGSMRYRRLGMQGSFAGIVSSFGMFVAF